MSRFLSHVLAGRPYLIVTRKDSLRVVGLIYLYAALVPTVLKAQTSPLKVCRVKRVRFPPDILVLIGTMNPVT